MTRNIAKIIKHSNYEASNIMTDIFLLQLSESLDWTDWVQQDQMTEAGTMCTVTGWGTLNEGGINLPNILHKVTVPVVSDEDCNE